MKQINYDYVQSEYKPIRAWGYFGLNILYAIPLIGWICLLVHAFSTKNANLRNYARSIFCSLLIFVIVVAIAVAVLFITGLDDVVLEYVKGLIG